MRWSPSGSSARICLTEMNVMEKFMVKDKREEVAEEKANMA